MDGSIPSASKARTKTGDRASHHASGEDSSGCGTSGSCQGKPLRRRGLRRSSSRPWPGIASSSTECSAEDQRPTRYPSVPSKSQTKNRTMGVSCPDFGALASERRYALKIPRRPARWGNAQAPPLIGINLYLHFMHYETNFRVLVQTQHLVPAGRLSRTCRASGPVLRSFPLR